MKKILQVSQVLLIIALFSLFAPDVLAQKNEAQPEYYKGKIIEIISEGETQSETENFPFQKVKLRVLSGNLKNSEITIEHGTTFSINETQKVKKNDTVVVAKIQGPDGDQFFISDKYRLNTVLILFGIFILIAVAFAKLKGVTSILGLCVSVLTIIYFIVPRILDGQNPLIISLIGTIVIAITSLYLAHGVTQKTTIALISTLITLAIAALFSVISVSLSKLTGAGTEEAFFLQLTPEKINLKGLLLGGIIMGALGVLDDITTAQTATVYEIKCANPSLRFPDLYKRGIAVGVEHIVSLINTLFLAYAGASLPLFLLFKINDSIPLWATLNSEFLVEEIIRTLVGSTALILAVPISTLLAALQFSTSENLKPTAGGHVHQY